MSTTYFNTAVPLPQQGTLTQAAAFLAYAASLPPIISAIILWLRPDDLGLVTTKFLLMYGGALMTFFGGVRWGIAVMRPTGPTFSNLFGGIWPMIVAMPVFMLDDQFIRFAIIIFSLPVLLWFDLRETRQSSNAPQWYLGVRMPLTFIVEIAYILAVIALMLL